MEGCITTRMHAVLPNVSSSCATGNENQVDKEGKKQRITSLSVHAWQSWIVTVKCHKFVECQEGCANGGEGEGERIETRPSALAQALFLLLACLIRWQIRLL